MPDGAGDLPRVVRHVLDRVVEVEHEVVHPRAAKVRFVLGQRRRAGNPAQASAAGAASGSARGRWVTPARVGGPEGIRRERPKRTLVRIEIDRTGLPLDLSKSHRRTEPTRSRLMEETSESPGARADRKPHAEVGLVAVRLRPAVEAALVILGRHVLDRTVPAVRRCRADRGDGDGADDVGSPVMKRPTGVGRANVQVIPSLETLVLRGSWRGARGGRFFV